MQRDFHYLQKCASTAFTCLYWSRLKSLYTKQRAGYEFYVVMRPVRVHLNPTSGPFYCGLKFNGSVLGCRPEDRIGVGVTHSSGYSPYHVMGQLSLGCRSKPGTCSPGGSTGPHGALRPLARSARPVHPRLARGQPAGPPPGGSPGEVGRVQSRHRPPRPSRPCAAALAGSVLGRPRGSGPPTPCAIN